MDQLPWSQIGSGSGWVACIVLASLIVRAFIKGDLYGRPAMEREQHEANEWRTESRIKDQQLLEKDIQLRHMAEVGKTVDAIMRSIHRNAQSGDRVSREEDS